MQNINQYLEKLHGIEQEINSLRQSYPKTISKVKNNKYQQINKTKKKIMETFQQLHAASFMLLLLGGQLWNVIYSTFYLWFICNLINLFSNLL